MELSTDSAIVKKAILKVKNLAFEDGVNEDNWTPKIHSTSVWLLIKDEGSMVGLCNIRIVQATMIEIHPYAMPDKCRKWKGIVKSILSWIYDNKKINKVIALIGVNHKTTYKAALKIGFKKEGLIKESYLKDGKLHDQHLIGLTRREIGEII